MLAFPAHASVHSLVSRRSLQVQAGPVTTSAVTAARSKTADDVDRSLRALVDMNGAELRVQWRRLYRSDPPRRVTHELLALALAWKIQERAYGGLTVSIKRRLLSLVSTLEQGGDLAGTCSVDLKPGARLMREWQGQTYSVEVVEEGFLYRGGQYRSLSAIARAITGTRWSGRRFFGLKQCPRTTHGAAGKSDA